MRKYKLIYDKPAEVWNDAIPMGNGRLGAMVYGQTGIDRIQLNEDSLWYGKFIDRNNRATKSKIKEIQKYVLDGKIQEAEDLIAQYMIGAPMTMRHYEPLGELDIALNQHTPFVLGWTPHSAGTQKYYSELDMMTGVNKITHTDADGITYTKEVFISYPADVLCVRIKANRPNAIQLDVQMDRCRLSDEKRPDGRRPGFFQRGGDWASMLLDENHTISDDTILIKGHAADLGFAGAVKMVTDGEYINPYTMLQTKNAACVCLYLAGSTENREDNPAEAVISRIEKAAKRSFDELLAEHIADFKAKMRSSELFLGGNSNSDDTPFDQRLEKVRNGEEDTGVTSLYFTFGRYLIVSGGRKNSAALNLQGIWNHDFIPTWDSKYTININTQMNYWPCEVTGLSDEHYSMFELIEKMWERGKDTAEIMYGCRGSMCHHNTDIYGDCAPQDVFLAATPWTTGGAWMALHLWEHYRFTLDKEFLNKYYHIMCDFAVFFVDFLIEDKNGKLVTCPSVSPENRYILPDGKDTPVCAAPTMDNQIIRALMNACIEAADILEINDEFISEFKRIIPLLPEHKIGSKGQLLEWQEEYPEMTPGMGHISHLFGVYPGDEINWLDTPELLGAAKRSLDIRMENGAGQGGWPLAWFICQHARMLDAYNTGEEIRRIAGSGGTRTMLNGRGVFQIDGNLGGCAGIAEALIQSHTGIIHLLPALPKTWKSGEAKGFMARGAYKIDMKWDGGKLTEAAIAGQYDGEPEIYGDTLEVWDKERKIETAKTTHGFKFKCESGKTYILCTFPKSPLLKGGVTK